MAEHRLSILMNLFGRYIVATAGNLSVRILRDADSLLDWNVRTSFWVRQQESCQVAILLLDTYHLPDNGNDFEDRPHQFRDDRTNSLESTRRFAWAFHGSNGCEKIVVNGCDLRQGKICAPPGLSIEHRFRC